MEPTKVLRVLMLALAASFVLIGGSIAFGQEAGGGDRDKRRIFARRVRVADGYGKLVAPLTNDLDVVEAD